MAQMFKEILGHIVTGLTYAAAKSSQIYGTKFHTAAKHYRTGDDSGNPEVLKNSVQSNTEIPPFVRQIIRYFTGVDGVTDYSSFFASL